MFNNKLELTIRICMLPLIYKEFYEKDYLEVLSSEEDIESYNKSFDKYMNKIYYILNKVYKLNNLDEVNLLLKKFFPRSSLESHKEDITKLYLEHLSKLSRTFITVRRGRIAFKYWETEGENDLIGPYKGLNKVALWNSLNRIFSTDILVVLYLLNNEYNDERYLTGYYSSLMLEDIQLEDVLKRGVAETHIHRGAAINFYISWENCMNLNGKKSEVFKNVFFSNVIFDVKISTELIFKTAISRLIMALYLKEKDNKSFKEFVIENEVFEDVIGEVFSGKENAKYTSENLIDIWDNIVKEFNLVENIEDDDYKRTKDILEIVFGEEFSSINTTMENIFLFKIINHIRNCSDSYLGKIFIQYLRIKNEIFQLKVEQNNIKGLLNFRDYSKRSTAIINGINEYTEVSYWKLLINNQLQNKHLKKLELRAMLPSKESETEIRKEVRKIVESFLEAYKEVLEDYKECSENDVPLIALIFSMGKKKDSSEPEKCWQNYFGEEVEEIYFERQRKIYIRQLNVLKDIREGKLSNYIVGVDAASIENNAEPWVFAPVYEKFRDSKYDKHLYLEDEKPKTQRGLGFTFHVGEDFRHILTGLRRIDEVIEHFKFHAGDRIGHGIALGVQVDKWVRENRIVIMPRIEYLENLLWVWGVYKDGNYDKFFDSAYLEQRIMEQAEVIYKNLNGITVYNLWKAYRNKFKEFEVNEEYRLNHSFEECISNNKILCCYSKQEHAIAWDEEKLTHAQHCKCYLERMLEPIQVLIEDSEIKSIEEVQKLLCRKVSRSGIIVETNPTSNTAIGEVESIFDHYIHALNKRGLVQEVEPESSIIVSINSDDPSVFNTNVSNEFAYIFYSLQEKGYSREDILLWIDKVRKYGMDSSFIEDRHKKAGEIINEIDTILKSMK